MKKLLSSLLLTVIFVTYVQAQDTDAAIELIREGIELHDKGDFKGAIKKYDAALEKDKDNLIALSEKAMSQYYDKQIAETIATCEQAIAKHPGKEGLETVYVTYGNALDSDGRTNAAVSAYDDAIKMFPKSSMLHFNKGVTLTKWNKSDEALPCFERAVVLDPKHPGSMNALGRIQFDNGAKVKALLPLLRFFVVEPATQRTASNLDLVLRLLSMNVTKGDNKNITLTIDAAALADTLPDGSPNPENFTTVELTMTLMSALDNEKKFKSMSQRERFLMKLETMFSSLKEMSESGKGFYWDFYVPYFVDMYDSKQVDTFSHIVFLTSGDAENDKWIKGHEKEIKAFYEWSSAYSWGR